MNKIQTLGVWRSSLWLGLLLLLFDPQFLPAQELAYQPAASSSPVLTRAEQEEFLHHAKLISKKALAIGVTNSQRAVLDDGKLRHDAHIQAIDVSRDVFSTPRGTERNFRDCYKYNIAAYELDKLLGLNMVPPSVERKVAGSTAAVTWWIENGMLEKDRLKNKIEPPDQQRWNQQMFLCRLFDQLIYNTDRNVGNLIITRDWKVWIIDHTRAFRLMTYLPSPQNLSKCDRTVLEKLRELDKTTLTQKLGHYLDSMEIQGILGRRDKIVKFFDDQIALKGEDSVLFDIGNSY